MGLAQRGIGDDAIMNSRRSSKAVFCGTFVLMSAFVATLASVSSGSIEKDRARLIEDGSAASFIGGIRLFAFGR